MSGSGLHAFSLRQLQYAVAIADTLSFRKAAERCHVSQPSLSAQLAHLETVLGVRLFERDRRRVLVTNAGREVIERARRVLVEADQLVETVTRASDPLSGTLRIGVIPTISPYLLPVVAPVLRATYPRLTLLWIEDKTSSLVRNLEAGTIDGALLALEAELGVVEHEVIARDDFLLATPLDHGLGTRKSPAKAAELRNASVLLLDDGHCLREQTLAVCSDAEARELEFRATSLPTLAQMVAAGAGVTLLPELAVPTEMRHAELRLRPFAAPAPYRTIALVWRARSPLQTGLHQIAATIRSAYPSPSTSRGRASNRHAATRGTARRKRGRRPR